MKSLLLLVLTAFPLGLSLRAWSPAPAGSEDEQASPPAHTLADLDWLAGQWLQKTDKASTEELWMPAKGGMMLGLNRSVAAERPAAYEFLRLQEDEEGVVYLASPGGKEPVPFRLTQVADDKALFENPEHDYPQRIVYRREGDVLTATIGTAEAMGPSWRYKRVGDVR